MREYWRDQSAFFRLTKQDIATLLHGWLLPPALLDQPVLLRGFNPFTRQPFERWTRVPDQPTSGLPDAIRHPDLSDCPWISTEGLQPNNMAALMQILFDCAHVVADDHWERFLSGPEDANDILQPVSSGFVTAVVGLTSTSLEAAASAWQSATDVEDLVEGWPPRVLERMQNFFGQSPAADYYFWTCR